MTRLRVGQILRRGMNGLTPIQYEALLDNADKVAPAHPRCAAS